MFKAFQWYPQTLTGFYSRFCFSWHLNLVQVAFLPLSLSLLFFSLSILFLCCNLIFWNSYLQWVHTHTHTHKWYSYFSRIMEDCRKKKCYLNVFWNHRVYEGTQSEPSKCNFYMESQHPFFFLLAFPLFSSWNEPKTSFSDSSC